MAFGPVDPSLDLPALEARVLERWRATDLAGQVQAARAGGPPWIFYEGPPTANGRPGLHHVWARVFKDLYPRFQTMQGHRVPRKGGWDSHGLPVEIEVEQELGLHSKHEIEAFGIAEFNERCRESVHRYVDDWVALTERSGVWIDTDDAYWTMDNDYIESVWWLLRQMWEAGLLYEGHRVTPVLRPVRHGAVARTSWASRACTATWSIRRSSSASPSSTATSTSSSGRRRRGRCSPTSPPRSAPTSTTCVCPRPMAGATWSWRTAAAARRWPERRRRARPGSGASSSAGATSRPFDLLPARGRRRAGRRGRLRLHRRRLGPRPPRSGLRRGRRRGRPGGGPRRAQPGRARRRVRRRGCTRWQGRFVKDADPEIIDDLRARGLLVAEEPYEHSYPHCWRCGTPLIYWAKTSWFVRTASQRDVLLRENETHRLASRAHQARPLRQVAGGQRRLGALPGPLLGHAAARLALRHCGHDTCIGSVGELEERSGRDLADLDLHRPAVDEVTFPCPSDGCTADARRLRAGARRVVRLGIDAVRAAPPPLRRDGPVRRVVPGRLHLRGHRPDAGLVLLAARRQHPRLRRDALPQRRVPRAHRRRRTGRRCRSPAATSSTRRRCSPTTAPTRCAGTSSRPARPGPAAGSPTRASREATRTSAAHALERARLLRHLRRPRRLGADGGRRRGRRGRADPRPRPVDPLRARRRRRRRHRGAGGLRRAPRGQPPRPLRRRPLELVRAPVPAPVLEGVEDPAPTPPSTTSSSTTARLLAPFCPFLADEVHRTLRGGRSVHLADWPAAVGPARRRARPSAWPRARRLVALGRAARTDAKVKVRQPLRRALLLHPDGLLDDDVRSQIAEELNVKAVEDVDTLSDLLTWRVTPNFRSLGPRLGPRSSRGQGCAGAGRRRRAAAGARRRPDHRGRRRGALPRRRGASGPTRHSSFALAEDGGWAVALDLDLDDDLRREGLARELVRALNELRKERGLAIADRVRLTLSGPDTVGAALAAHGPWIAGEVLAVELLWVDGADGLDRPPEVGRRRAPDHRRRRRRGGRGAGARRGLSAAATAAGRAVGAGSSARARRRGCRARGRARGSCPQGRCR